MDPRLIYYILLAAFIGVGVKHLYRGRGKRGITHFFAWVGIAVFFVLLYSFREQATMVKNRIAGELFPSSATTYADGSIQLRLSADQHFHANVLINGYRRRFLIDTGATGNVISTATAQKAGITIDPTQFTRHMRTANGVVRAAPIKVDLRIGDYLFKDQTVLVSGGQSDTNVLGMSFLSLFSSVEVTKTTLTLHSPYGAHDTR